MQELIVNLHMHTVYSDGSGTHADLAQAALKSNLDVLLVTDHNVWVQGVDRYHRQGKKRLLLMTGEEIHDQARDPQKNHLLVFGANRELSTLAEDPQALISAVKQAGGICFLAHPVDPALPAFGETDISWVDWDVHSFTGLELWNGFSELKAVARGKLDGLFYGFFPEAIAHQPLPEVLRRWDELQTRGQRIMAVGGSDAHARRMSLGPIHRTIFPYEFHFSAINTHILTPTGLTGDLSHDRQMVFDALAAGHSFIGYDLAASTAGFRFSAQGRGSSALIGDEITAQDPVTLQVKIPTPAEIRLLKDGNVIRTTHGEALVLITGETGVYRVEVYRRYLGKERGWIYSNPIFIR
jgi:PHP domain